MKNAPVQLRKAGFSDIKSLQNLFKHALEADFSYFPVAYRNQVRRQNSYYYLLRSLLNKQRVILLARQGGQLIGYVIGSGHADKAGELYWLYVNPSTRGKRVGQQLLEEAVMELRNQGMSHVSLLTYNYQNYYKRFGFVETGMQQVHGVEVHVMRLEFKEND